MAFGGGSCNAETPEPISIKLNSDQIDHPTPRAKFGYNRFKGGVAAHVRNSPLGVNFFPCVRLQTSPLDRPTPLMA